MVARNVNKKTTTWGLTCHHHHHHHRQGGRRRRRRWEGRRWMAKGNIHPIHLPLHTLIKPICPSTSLHTYKRPCQSHTWRTRSYRRGESKRPADDFDDDVLYLGYTMSVMRILSECEVHDRLMIHAAYPSVPLGTRTRSWRPVLKAACGWRTTRTAQG